jgi:futalosine hydrolase
VGEIPGNLVAMTKILIVTAVEAEREALLYGLSPARQGRVDVVAGGVGAVAAAIATASVLTASIAAGHYRLAVAAGIGGAFPGVAGPGDLLQAGRIIAADLGAQTPEGFASLDQLGIGQSVTCSARPLAGIDAITGDLLTVTTATGSAERARELLTRHPGAVGEAMEGYGVALAGLRFGIPVAEIRAVSNLIGPRDRSAWQIPQALAALSAVAGALVEGN